MSKPDGKTVMTRPASRRRLVVIGAVLGIFVILNIVQFPRGPYFDCSFDNRDGYRMQYGFPFVFLKRSVTTTSCTWPDQSEKAAEESREYSTHHILPLAFFGNLIVAGGAVLLLSKLLERRV